MSRMQLFWLVLGAIQVLFVGWYTSFGGPLTPEEIARYREVVVEVSDSPEALARWMHFMETDTGDDFAMLNAIHMRETPTPGPGIAPGETSEEVLARYTVPFLGRALRSAAHPVMMGTAATEAMDVWGLEGAKQWSAGALVRYRSRRDLMEQVVALRDAGDTGIHAFKIAAMQKTIAFPLDPWFQLGDPRLVLAGLLLIVGLATQLVVDRRAAASAR